MTEGTVEGQDTLTARIPQNKTLKISGRGVCRKPHLHTLHPT